MSKKQDTSEAATEVAKPKPGTVWLDYRGKTGRAQEYDHDGPRLISRPDADPVVIRPGLNKVEGVPGFVELPTVAALLLSGQIVLTDAALRGFESPGNLRDLISRTWSADALERIQDLEEAKPQAGPTKERRSQELLGLIDKRLRRALGRRTIDTSGMHSQAADKAITAAA
jgi:hypothetical protein